MLLSNIQMSAALIKHRFNDMDYDIDGFVSQLSASGRFVELIDKLSEEAANRIKYNNNKKFFIVSSDTHEDPVYNEKGTKQRSKGKKYDIDGFISQVLVSKNIHELLTKLTVNAASKIMRFRTGTENSYENPPKNNQVNDAKTREELPGKVDIQAIIKHMVSLSEDLKLKYNDDESDLSTKLQSKEETTESVNKDHIRKTLVSTSKNNVTERNKTDSKNKTIDLNKRTQDNAKGHYGKAAPNRHNEISHSVHNGTDGEDQENSKKKYKSLEVQSSSQEHINSREAQNSELKVNILKQKTSHRHKSITEEENLSSLDVENHSPPPSEEKTNREVAETKEETENSSTENIVVNLGDEDSVINNRMVSYDNPYNEDRGSPERPQERIIRKEGGKLYTYVQDADYEEYHEKMAKWRKTHPENATDFLK